VGVDRRRKSTFTTAPAARRRTTSRGGRVLKERIGSRERFTTVTQRRPASCPVGRRPSNLVVAECCARRSHASKKRRLYVPARPGPRCALYCASRSPCDVIIVAPECAYGRRRNTDMISTADNHAYLEPTRIDTNAGFRRFEKASVFEGNAEAGLPPRIVT